MTIADTKVTIKASSVRDVVQAAIDRAKTDSAHSLLEIIETRALERADAIDKELAAGKTIGPLAGVPFIAKDNMLTFGSSTTAASKLLENFEAPFQS